MGDRKFGSRSSQTSALDIYICRFLARHSALLGEGKDSLAGWISVRIMCLCGISGDGADADVMVLTPWFHSGTAL